MDASQSTTPELNSGNPLLRRRLKMGYMAGRRGGRRRNRIMGHWVEDASPTLGAEVTAEFREATGDEIISEAQTLIARRLRPGAKLLSSPETIEVFLRVFLGPLDYEVFGVIYLDSDHRFIAVQNLFRGTIDSCSVYTREIIQSVLEHRAAAVVLYHNHPSGTADPSNADKATTRRIKDALALIDVKLLDHFIVGETVLSFSRAGEL